MAPLRCAAKFDPFLSLDCAPTPSTLAQSKERKGSNFAIWQHWTKVFVRLFFNGKQVCQSASRPLSDDFVVPFGHIFPLRIVQWPESLRLQVRP